nr:phage holin family protein [Limosilactobacillus kribbianus]
MHLLLTQPPQHILYIQYFASMIDNVLIEWFVLAIVIDIVTGFFKSIITHRTISSKGTGGLLKHAAVIILTLTVYPMLELCGLGQAGDSLVFFFSYFTWFLLSKTGAKWDYRYHHG